MPNSDLVNSVVKALDILQFVSDRPEGVRLGEIVDAFGLKRPTALQSRAHAAGASLSGAGRGRESCGSAQRPASCWPVSGAARSLRRPNGSCRGFPDAFPMRY